MAENDVNTAVLIGSLKHSLDGLNAREKKLLQQEVEQKRSISSKELRVRGLSSPTARVYPSMKSPPSSAVTQWNPSNRRRERLQEKKKDPTTARTKKPFALEDAAKILSAEAGSPLPGPALQNLTAQEMRMKYQQQRSLRRAYTCISTSKGPPENDFIMKSILADSDDSDSEEEEVWEKPRCRHNRAMTVQYDMKEDPEMKSTFQILALQPEMTSSQMQSAMENAPDIIQYDMEFKLNDEENSEFIAAEEEAEEEVDSLPEMLPEQKHRKLKLMKSIILSQGNLALKAAERRELRERMLVTRKKLIEELVSSERVFLNQVVCLFTKFSEPLRAGLVNESDHRILFPSSLMDIHVFSANLLRDLDKFLRHNFDNETSRLSVKLMQYAAKLHGSFAEYACHYEDITQKAKELQRKKKHVADIMTQMNGLSFFSLAIVPVQRPSRYLLLIKGIVDHTPKDHCDYGDMLEVKHIFSKENDQINETLRSFGEKKKVRNIAKKTRKRRLQDRASRLLIKRGMITLVDDDFLSKKQSLMEVYLFNDLLIGGKFQSKKIGGLMASIFSSGKETDFVTMIELQIDDSFVVESLPDSYDPEISNILIVKSKFQSVLLSFQSQREKHSWLHAFQKCGSFGVVEDCAEKYDGPWAPVLAPKWWSSQCVSCGDSLKRKKTKHCVSCGSRMCVNCSEGERCMPCKELFSSDPRSSTSRRLSSKVEVGVAAHIWGYPRKDDILLSPRAATPGPPQSKRKKKNKLPPLEKRYSIPFNAAPLPNLVKTELNLSILYCERTESAHDVIRRVFRKNFPLLDLDPDDYGLELQDYPRQYIIGKKPLERYHVLKNINERVSVRIRNKTYLVFLTEALITVDIVRSPTRIPTVRRDQARFILPMPSSFSEDGSISVE